MTQKTLQLCENLYKAWYKGFVPGMNRIRILWKTAPIMLVEGYFSMIATGRYTRSTIFCVKDTVKDIDAFR